MTQTEPRHQSRSRMVSVRLSPIEHGEIVNFAMSCNCSVSDLLRDVCLGITQVQTSQPFSLKSIIRKLRKLTKQLQELSLAMSSESNDYDKSASVTFIDSAGTQLLELVDELEEIRVSSKIWWNKN